MFDNLVESDSHKEDMSRKGSFIFVPHWPSTQCSVSPFSSRSISVSTLHLDNQNLDLMTLVAPVPVPPQQNTRKTRRGEAAEG